MCVWMYLNFHWKKTQIVQVWKTISIFTISILREYPIQTFFSMWVNNAMLWKQNNSDCPEQNLTFLVKVSVAIDFQSVYPTVAIYSRESKMNQANYTRNEASVYFVWINNLKIHMLAAKKRDAC